MKKPLQILLLVMGSLFLTEEMAAQDPEFTQFYANPLYLNPALAGSRICPRFNMSYRMEWPGVYGTYSTLGVSMDKLAYNIKGGVGLMLVNDNAAKGTLKTTGIGLIYAPIIPISRSISWATAIQVGYWQKSVNWSKLTFGDQIDPARGFIYNTDEIPGASTRGNFDVSAGTVIYSKQFYAGFAVHHILTPNESFLDGTSPLPRKYTGHAGATIPLGGKYSESYISPNILYQAQGDFRQMNIGLYAKKESIVGGLWYRGNDSFIVLVGLETESGLKMGYSYDVTISKLTNATAGSHEITLGYQMKCKPKHQHYRPVSCPSF